MAMLWDMSMKLEQPIELIDDKITFILEKIDDELIHHC